MNERKPSSLDKNFQSAVANVLRYRSTHSKQIDQFLAALQLPEADKNKAQLMLALTTTRTANEQLGHACQTLIDALYSDPTTEKRNYIGDERLKTEKQQPSSQHPNHQIIQPYNSYDVVMRYFPNDETKILDDSLYAEFVTLKKTLLAPKMQDMIYGKTSVKNQTDITKFIRLIKLIQDLLGKLENDVLPSKMNTLTGRLDFIFKPKKNRRFEYTIFHLTVICLRRIQLELCHTLTRNIVSLPKEHQNYDAILLYLEIAREQFLESAASVDFWKLIDNCLFEDIQPIKALPQPKEHKAITHYTIDLDQRRDLSTRMNEAMTLYGQRKAKDATKLIDSVIRQLPDDISNNIAITDYNLLEMLVSAYIYKIRFIAIDKEEEKGAFLENDVPLYLTKLIMVLNNSSKLMIIKLYQKNPHLQLYIENIIQVINEMFIEIKKDARTVISLQKGVQPIQFAAQLAMAGLIDANLISLSSDFILDMGSRYPQFADGSLSIAQVFYNEYLALMQKINQPKTQKQLTVSEEKLLESKEDLAQINALIEEHENEIKKERDLLKKQEDAAKEKAKKKRQALKVKAQSVSSVEHKGDAKEMESKSPSTEITRAQQAYDVIVKATELKDYREKIKKYREIMAIAKETHNDFYYVAAIIEIAHLLINQAETNLAKVKRFSLSHDHEQTLSLLTETTDFFKEAKSLAETALAYATSYLPEHDTKGEKLKNIRHLMQSIHHTLQNASQSVVKTHQYIVEREKKTESRILQFIESRSRAMRHMKDRWHNNPNPKNIYRNKLAEMMSNKITLQKIQTTLYDNHVNLLCPPLKEIQLLCPPQKTDDSDFANRLKQLTDQRAPVLALTYVDTKESDSQNTSVSYEHTSSTASFFANVRRFLTDDDVKRIRCVAKGLSKV